jgi:DNA-directed RNA polymerase specialized sigma24 family protein
VTETTEKKEVPKLSRSAFAQAYLDGFQSTWRFLLSRGIHPAKAEEVAQAAWSRGWERRDSLRDAGRIVEWVNTIALNVFRNLLRRRRETAELPLHMEGGSGISTAGIEIGKALSACNETERALLIDRYVNGYSSQEVAEKHGLSPVAVRVRTMRARRKAQARLAGDGGSSRLAPTAA